MSERIVRGSSVKATDILYKKGSRLGALKFNGAAYRIRTYDALIRSQVLYPAEVTPRALTI